MENPYQSSSVNPSTPAHSNVYNSQDLEASQTAIYFLAASKGWIRFLSVLTFICLGLFGIGLISALTNIGRSGASEILGLLFILVLCVLTFFLALRLTLYANAIDRLISSRNPMELETAMIQQMKYWRLSGIIIIFGLLIAILGIIAG